MMIVNGIYKERGYTNRCKHSSTIYDYDYHFNNHFFI